MWIGETTILAGAADPHPGPGWACTNLPTQVPNILVVKCPEPGTFIAHSIIKILLSGVPI